MGCILALETGGAPPCVAVMVTRPGEATRIVEKHGTPGRHDEELVGLVSQVFSEAEICAADLTAIGLGQGPGSFTGLRIGYAFAQGLAFSLQIPVVEVCSYRAAALSIARNGEIVVIGDARRDEYFYARFMRSDLAQAGSKLLQLEGVRLCTALDLERNLASCTTDFALVDLSLVLQEVSQVQKQPSALAQGLRLKALSAKNVASCVAQVVEELSLSAVAQGIGPRALSELEPRYLRAVAAKTISERSIPAR